MSEQDCLRRFIFEDLGVRGEWVRLNESWQLAKQNHDYSPLVQQQLGHAIAAVAMLSATIKFKGSLILQAQGDGDLKAVVAQCTHDRRIRGWARCDVDQLQSGTLQDMYGYGQLVLTIKSDDAEPYQGIVALTGNKLSTALQSYFTRSEQLRTRIWLFADDTQVSGLLLQELPAQEGYQADWERIEMLAETITEQELIELPCEEMLYRLFNEEKVRVYAPETVNFSCSCSIEKIEATLLSLGRESLEELLQQHDQITVDCEFCSEKYCFDCVDVERILTKTASECRSETQH